MEWGMLALIGRVGLIGGVRRAAHLECRARFACAIPTNSINCPSRHLPLAIMKSILSLILVCLLAAGCQTGNPKVPLPPPDNSSSNILSAGDVVSIAFVGSPELNQTQKIRRDGMLNLLMIGDVRAAGKTIPRLREDLTQRYKGKLTNPELMLSLESASPAVYVSGAVNKGGKVELTRNLTILEVIMEAGGFTRGLADPKHVQVIRKINGKHETFVVNLAPAMQGQPTRAVYVQAYDIIVVPERWL